MLFCSVTVRTLKFCPPGRSHLYDTALAAMVATLHMKSPDLIHMNQKFVPFPNLSLLPPPLVPGNRFLLSVSMRLAFFLSFF